MVTTSRHTRQEIVGIVGASDLIIDGQRVDQRSVVGRRWRQNIADLAMQLGDTVTPAEGMLLRRAATFAALCERDEAALVRGDAVDEEGYRRNATALGAALVKLGLAAKSRDVTKAQSKLYDAHAAAILADA